MNRTQKKAMKKHQEVQRARIEATEAFVAQLARDLFVEIAPQLFDSDLFNDEPFSDRDRTTLTKIGHDCMEAAVTYFDALQTFRKPAPPAKGAP